MRRWLVRQLCADHYGFTGIFAGREVVLGKLGDVSLFVFRTLYAARGRGMAVEREASKRYATNITTTTHASPSSGAMIVALIQKRDRFPKMRVSQAPKNARASVSC
jgi:hypothetical protein